MGANIFKVDGDRVDSIEEFRRKEKDSEWKNVLYYPETLTSDSRNPLVFKNKRFFEVSFKDTDISKVRFIRCTFERCLFIGASLTDCEFIDCTFIGTNTDKCKIAGCLIDPSDFDKNFDFKTDTNIAIDLYQRLYKNLTEEHQPERAIDSLYQMKRAEYYHLNSQRKRGVIGFWQYVLTKVMLALYDFISGYGVKTLRVLRFVVLLLILFSGINYLFQNAIFGDGKTYSFIDAVYFTSVTVTTLGFGDVVPKTQGGRVLISGEAFIGIVVILIPVRRGNTRIEVKIIMYSVAEFGSVSRNTADQYSDRDLLIVCPAQKKFVLREHYRELGYCVTWLSKDQLRFMKGSGSLFLQHLKNEANILIDSEHALRAFLDSCLLTPPTNGEIAKCEATLRFVAVCPRNVELSAWRADFLFCVSRDYLIKRIARCGRALFGLEDIEIACKELFALNGDEFNFLYELRKAKSAYRGNIEIYQDLSFLTDQWLSILNRRFKINFERAQSMDIDSVAPYAAEFNFNSAYERLRFLEGLYLAAYSRGAVHPQHGRLMKYIKEPNFYSSTHQCKVPDMQEYLRDVAMLVLNTSSKGAQFPLGFPALQVQL